MKISEDIKSISYVKRHTNEVLDQIRQTGRPVIITQNGEPVGILEDVKAYEEHQETAALLELVRQGIEEIRAGENLSHSDVVESVRGRLKE